MTMNTEDKFPLLKSYFASEPRVAMAFVFGSYAKGRVTEDSDLDIAVYFQSDSPQLEWEESRVYPEEDEIWGNMDRITGMNTDLVVLNRAPATLADSILHEGIPLSIKDPGLWTRFFLSTSDQADSMREFVQDFRKIKERSRSLNERDAEHLARIIDFMGTELQDFSSFQKVSQREYTQETALRRNLERWIENLMNSTIDTAKILLASFKQKIPQTYRDALLELAYLENFDPKTAETLAVFAKLRNILAHEYLDIRYQQIKSFLQTAEPALKNLLAYTKGILP